MNLFYCIGDQDTVAGFKLAGVNGFIPAGYEDAIDAFNKVLADYSIMILLLTEEVAFSLSNQIIEHRLSGKNPMIVEIPDGLSGDFKGGSLMDSIKKAIGISL